MCKGKLIKHPESHMDPAHSVIDYDGLRVYGGYSLVAGQHQT